MHLFSLSLSLSLCISFYVSFSLSFSLSLSVCLSLCFSVCLFLPVSLSLSLSLSLSVYLSFPVSLSVRLSFSSFKQIYKLVQPKSHWLRPQLLDTWFITHLISNYGELFTKSLLCHPGLASLKPCLKFQVWASIHNVFHISCCPNMFVRREKKNEVFLYF